MTLKICLKCDNPIYTDDRECYFCGPAPSVEVHTFSLWLGYFDGEAFWNDFNEFVAPKLKVKLVFYSHIYTEDDEIAHIRMREGQMYYMVPQE